jgi:murein DD-endopeptidase MepM/ murein hydrolase activator NlpD
MPVDGRISSGFGARVAPTKGASSYHPAIDIAAPIGTPVKAAAGGTVIYVGKMGGLGNVVIVDHGGGTITEYGHLSSILTKKGSAVGQGDVIAQVGSTGISTGPHLDYRVKVGGKYVDPRTGRFSTDSVAAGIKAGTAAQREEDKAAAEKERLLQRITQRASEEWAQEQKVTLEMREQNELIDGAERRASWKPRRQRLSSARLLKPVDEATGRREENRRGLY